MTTAYATSEGWRRSVSAARSFARTRWRPLLLAYGLAAAFVGLIQLDRGLPERAQLQSGRENDLRASIEVMERGGPPLLGSRVQYSSSVAHEPSLIYPVGRGDDQGLYLYVPVLARTLGVRDPSTVLRWLVVALTFPMLAIAPFLFFSATKALLGALVMPFVLAAQIISIGASDVYWAAAWAVLAGIPLVWYGSRRWSRSSLIWIGSAALVAGFGSSLRAQAGLPVLLAIAIALLIRPLRWRYRLAIALTAAFCYFGAASALVESARLYRDLSVGESFASRYQPSHIFWHGAYIGLGFMPNQYGLAWDDAVAITAAARVDPQAELGTPRYEDVVRGLYFEILRNDPGFAIRGYLLKIGASLNDAVERYWSVLLLLPLASTIGARRTRVARHALLVLPAFAVTLIPPVITIPLPEYESGWFAAWGLAMMLGIAAFAGLVEQIVAGEFSSLRGPGARTPGWTSDWQSEVAAVFRRAARNMIVILALAVATLSLVLGPYAAEASDDAYYRLGQKPLIRSSASETSVAISTWTFEKGLPAGWTSLRGVGLAQESDGVRVSTTKEKLGYQIESPTIRLGAGAYRALMRGVVVSGGLYVGVLDMASNRWLATAYYWSGQQGFADSDMMVAFALTQPADIQVVVSNWTPRPAASVWKIKSVLLLPTALP